VKNIGVGTAKMISMKIDSQNIYDLIEVINEVDPTNTINCDTKGKNLELTIDNTTFGLSKSLIIEKAYLSPNSDENYEIFIPDPYALLLHKIFELGSEGIKKIPEIKITLSYEDIQGKKYEQNITLEIDPPFYYIDEDGNGKASYLFKMK